MYQGVGECVYQGVGECVYQGVGECVYLGVGECVYQENRSQVTSGIFHVIIHQNWGISKISITQLVV